MTRIVGTLKNSGREVLDATLRVTLDAPFVDLSTDPDALMLPAAKEFPITGGVIDIDLAQSETSGITYFFEILITTTSVTYFTESGLEYSGPVVLHTDGKYYAGFLYSPSAPQVYRVETQNQQELSSFHALVPNVPQVEFTSLIKTGISTDTLDSSVRRIAALLTSDEQYAEILRGGPYIQGNYSPAVYYRKGDLVQYAGSAWLYINSVPKADQTPSVTNTEHWLQFGAKGDPGGAIAGQDTPFDPTGWDGAQWVPTANVLRDYLVQLAPLFSPAFDGVPTCPTPSTSSDDTTIVNSAWVNLAIADFAGNASFSNNPTAPTQATENNSTRIATTAFVKSTIQRYSRLTQQFSSGVNAGDATVGGDFIRPINTIDVNSGDILALASNTFTVRAGTYLVRAYAVFLSGVGLNRLMLWNSVTNAPILFGLVGATTASSLQGRITLSANTDCQLRYRCQTSVTNGQGTALGVTGQTEVYASVEFWRID